MDKELLTRIAIALEKIGDALTESKPKGILDPKAITNPRTSLPTTKKPAGDVHRLIGVYISAFQLRYGKQARPDVGGKVQGLLKNLLKDHPAERLVGLIQAFLQMDDPWFVTKTHDFPTLYENVGKVQTALRNGTPRAEDNRYWEKVFGSKIEGVSNEKVLGKGSEERKLLEVGGGN